MSDPTTTSIDLDDVAMHLDVSERICDQFQQELDPVRDLEANVIAACDIGPGPTIAVLDHLIEMWRDHDALLRTLHDTLKANGYTGDVRVATQVVRDAVALANGPIALTDAEMFDDGLDLVIDGGSGDDVVSVTQRSDGRFVVTVNGATRILSAEQSARLVVRGGSGADTITVAPYDQPTVIGPGGPIPTGAEVMGVRIDGGRGNDTITGGRGDDTITGGFGRDYIDGGRGDDRLDGDGGFDVIYGGHGDDEIYGGRGTDYLDGGWGADIVSGQHGADVVAGGRGDDRLYGGSDDDVLIAGSGRDWIADTGDGDADSVFAQADDDLYLDPAATVDRFDVYDPESSQISIDGGAGTEFGDRVRADLDTLASIPVGAAILANIDGNASGHTVTIGVGDNEASTTGTGNVWEQGGVTGDGRSAEIGYDVSDIRYYENQPHEDWMNAPPGVTLAHELLHTDDYVNGELDPGRSVQIEHDGAGNPVLDASGDQVQQTDASGNPLEANNRELSVVGLPFDEDDEDASAGAPTSGVGELDANTRPLTENALRDQLGLPTRERY